MKRRFELLVLLILIVPGHFSTVALSQTPLFLSGQVNWNTGFPANSVQVRLMHGSNTVATTYTNQAGRFAFFGIGGQPFQYSLQVWTGNQMRGQAGLAGVHIGGQAPVITIQ
jgi:hypothetical protein